MEWIIDNLQFVIAMILLVAYGLRGLGRRGQQEEEEDGSAPMEGAGPQYDVDEQERTRRIQEEIRRRILARQQGREPGKTVIVDERGFQEELPPEREPPMVRRVQEAPPPVPPPIPRARPFQQEVPSPPPAAAPAGLSAAEQAIVDRQRTLEEQLRKLQATPNANIADAGAYRRQKTPYKIGHAAMGFSKSLRHDLRNPGSLRRAILLREILAMPQGLQAGPPTLPRR